MAAPFNIRIDLDPVTDGIVQERKIIPFTGDISKRQIIRHLAQ